MIWYICNILYGPYHIKYFYKYPIKGLDTDQNIICELRSGQLFGELALLYNCKRTATVTTKTTVSLWALEREIFQHIVRSAGEERDKERLNLLSKVKDLKSLPDEKLRKIVDCLEEEEYEDNECILRQVQFKMTIAL